MLRVTGIKLPLDFGIANDPEMLACAAARRLGISRSEIAFSSLARRSIDARRRSEVHFEASAYVELASAYDERSLAEQSSCAKLIEWPPPDALLQIESMRDAGRLPTTAECGSQSRPVVVGSGPAGLFAALALASAGKSPMVIERGPEVSKRAKAIARFEGCGELDENANVQFGEGGAGTYSDGKLTTGVSSPLSTTVLRAFVDAGAPEEILWQAKPHIGTDLLPGVVNSLRRRIESLGGEFAFKTRFVDMTLRTDGSLGSITLQHDDGSSDEIACGTLFLAIGHSARDTYAMLLESGLAMERKPFSIGARIEHPQETIDEAQYGTARHHPAIGPADYKLSCHLDSGRSAYTFCMCPGGQVVAAASEPGGLVVNGMSRFARDGNNANSALLVGVGPDDFGSGGVLAGIEFQRRWERAAFEAGGSEYMAPAQLVGDLLSGRASKRSGSVEPSYPLGVKWTNLSRVLPKFVVDTMADALPILGKKIAGFDMPDAVLTGVETRSSAPVRILRDRDTLQSSVPGIYPCGEGAGYAGGIMSSAIDGLRCAMAFLGISPTE